MDTLIVILGPTATGKTSLAASVCAAAGGSVISADSRQVYRGMNLGTGKDLQEYTIGEMRIPYFLIDIAGPEEEYNLFRFLKDYNAARDAVRRSNRIPVLCGGTGLYLEAVIEGYELTDAAPDLKLRNRLSGKSMEQLTEILKSYRPVHNTTDTLSEMRLLRAIEIEVAKQQGARVIRPAGADATHIFGVHFPKEEIRERITFRLKQRLSEGMMEEVQDLMTAGISAEKLDFFGLEYRYVSAYLTGKLNYNDMFQKLNAAIHDFAKRQETWFRRMERKGCPIQWIDGHWALEEKTRFILQKIAEGQP